MRKITDLLKEWIAETALNEKNYILFDEVQEKREIDNVEKNINVLYMYCAYPRLLIGIQGLLVKKYKKLLEEFNIDEIKIVKTNKYFLKGNRQEIEE